MAQRQKKKHRRVPSDAVQGEGSFVLVRTPGFSDLKDLGEIDDLSDTNQAVKAIGPLLASLVIDWDWVDDEDNPLPKPSDQPGVIDDLTFQEQKFLLDALDLGSLADLKN